mgnify:CR=1 FL=1
MLPFGVTETLRVADVWLIFVAGFVVTVGGFPPERVNGNISPYTPTPPQTLERYPSALK